MNETDRIVEAARRYVAAIRAKDGACAVDYHHGGIEEWSLAERERDAAEENLIRAVEPVWRGPRD